MSVCQEYFLKVTCPLLSFFLLCYLGLHHLNHCFSFHLNRLKILIIPVRVPFQEVFLKLYLPQ